MHAEKGLRVLVGVGLVLVLCLSAYGQVPPTKLREKLVEYQKLLEEKRAGGVDVTKAEELERKSREAGLAGDEKKSLNLLEQAIAALKGKEKQAVPSEKEIDISEKLAKLQKLLKEKKSSREDVSEAMKLYEEASELLDKAILTLEKGKTPGDRGEPGMDIRQKLMKFHKLVEERRAAGEDVSEAMKLHDQSKEMAMKGDNKKAEELIDKAISLLENTSKKREGKERTKKFNLSGLAANKVLVTKAVPKYETGKEVINYNTDFNTETINVKNGKADITLGESPVFIELDKAYPKVVLTDYKDSPFGVVEYFVNFDTISHYVNDLGIKSIRMGGVHGVSWDRIEDRGPEPVQFKGWSWNDNLFKDLTDNDIEICAVIIGGKPKDIIDKLDKYRDFVASVAERYDGDGINDAEGSPVVTYWEIENEPDLMPPWEGRVELIDDYALMLKTAYTAIKSANPKAKVAIGAMAGNIDYYKKVFKELEKIKKKDEKYFDVFNYHYYGYYNHYGKDRISTDVAQEIKSLSDIKDLLKDYNYQDVEIIITEAGTPSGQPTGVVHNGQSETQQALSLLKRYVYPVSKGVDRIYWLGINEAPFDVEGYYGRMALVYKNSKTLAYYTYKLMVEKLEGADWDNIEVVVDGKDNIYVYRFNRKDLGKPVYVAWWDYLE